MSIDADRLRRAYDARFGYANEIVHVRREDARAAERVPASEVLPARLADALPFDPYSHQAEALGRLADGENVTVATDTASGKTLVYALDFARRYLADPEATALFVYPMRALTRDQYEAVEGLLCGTLGLDVRVGVYDGDTPSDRKREIRRNANVVLTNFAGLNQYLPHHDQWARIYGNLELVVVDESHQYTGVHGMHVAWVVRRLQRLVAAYGGDPQYVLTTATVGNPREHAETLTGRPFSLVDEDGSEQGARDVVFWNPPIERPGEGDDDASDDFASSTSFVANELTALLADADVQTLLFTDSRTMTEVGGRRVESLAGPGVRVSAYHAGHGQETRRRTERGLRDGSLDAVVSTSALELGIDVGGLDATVLSGYPGTRQRFWQRIGRAGRGAGRSLSVVVADYASLDQYVVRNPEHVFEERVENAVVDRSNNAVYARHVLCAANESPLTWEDADAFGGAERLERAVGMWKTTGLLAGTLDAGVSFTRTSRPEADVDLYTTGESSFEVRLRDGEIDHEPIERTRAYRDFHEGAVVLHDGREYVVEALEEDTADPYVRLSEQPDVSYYTRTQRSVSVEGLSPSESRDLGEFVVHRGDAEVVTHYHSYEERRISNNARLGQYPTGLPPLTMRTHAVWIEPSDALARELLREFADPDVVADLGDGEGTSFALDPREDDADAPRPPDPVERAVYLGGLHAAEHAMIGGAPLTMTMDKRDLGGLSTLNHPETATTGGLFVYDGVPGGVGFSHAIYDRLALVAETTRDLVEGCACGRVDGCPACSMDENCGDDNEPLHNPAAVWLLDRLASALRSADTTADPDANPD